MQNHSLEIHVIQIPDRNQLQDLNYYLHWTDSRHRV